MWVAAIGPSEPYLGDPLRVHAPGSPEIVIDGTRRLGPTSSRLMLDSARASENAADDRRVPPRAALRSWHLVSVEAVGNRAQEVAAGPLTLNAAQDGLRHASGPFIRRRPRERLSTSWTNQTSKSLELEAELLIWVRRLRQRGTTIASDGLSPAGDRPGVPLSSSLPASAAWTNGCSYTSSRNLGSSGGQHA